MMDKSREREPSPFHHLIVEDVDVASLLCLHNHWKPQKRLCITATLRYSCIFSCVYPGSFLDTACLVCLPPSSLCFSAWSNQVGCSSSLYHIFQCLKDTVWVTTSKFKRASITLRVGIQGSKLLCSTKTSFSSSCVMFGKLLEYLLP